MAAEQRRRPACGLWRRAAAALGLGLGLSLAGSAEALNAAGVGLAPRAGAALALGGTWRSGAPVRGRGSWVTMQATREPPTPAPAPETEPEPVPVPTTVALPVPELDQETGKELAVAAPGAQQELAGQEEQEGAPLWVYKGMILLVAFFWGTNFPAVRFIEEFDVPSSTLAGARFGIAALALLPSLIGKEKDIWIASLEAGLWSGIGYLAQAIGLESAAASKAAFICSLHVVLVPFVSRIFGLAEIKRRQWAAAALALLGVALLEGAGSSAPTAGDALLLLQPIGFGLSYLRVEDANEKYPGECLAISAGQLLAVALVSFAWMGFDAANGIAPALGPIMQSKMAIGATLYTGLVTTSLTIFLQTLALQRVSATDMTVLISTEPLVAALISVFVLGEQLSPLGGLGGLIIFCTCVGSELLAAKELEAEKEAAGAVGL